MRVVARDFRDASWVELDLRDGYIDGVQLLDHPRGADPEDDWVAPAFWDIQSNGRWGHSFSSPEITIDQVASIIRAQAPMGTARLCPTLITAPVDHLVHGVRTIAAACQRYPDVADRVIGIHLEGPFISEQEGYRGAHPAGSVIDPDWDLFLKIQDASGGRIVLITLAPERAGAIDFIRRATSAGVVVAIGHTAAVGATIRTAIDAGALLSTHLGNGIVSQLPRHPNAIWTQAASKTLMASFIADGHHLDLEALRVLALAKGPAQTLLISDASPLAGLPPGDYGEWSVDPSGKIVVAGTPYLAGSNLGLEVGLRNLLCATDWTFEQAIASVTTNPARLLGRPMPRLSASEPADLIIYRWAEPRRFALRRVCIGGQWEFG
jgi:N-acetylglucosamine-6-phosphate deacetylase